MFVFYPQDAEGACLLPECAMLMLGQTMMLTVRFQSALTTVTGKLFGHMFLTHLCLPISQIVLLQDFRP